MKLRTIERVSRYQPSTITNSRILNGTEIITNWSDHAHAWSTQTVTLPAGTHTLTFEFYENGGQNTWQFWRN